MDFALVAKSVCLGACTTCRGFGMRLDAGEPLPTIQVSRLTGPDLVSRLILV